MKSKLRSVLAVFVTLVLVMSTTFTSLMIVAADTDIGDYQGGAVSLIEHTHNYVPVVTNPTCTSQGYTTHTCTICDDEYVDTYVNALGHTVGDWLSNGNEHWHYCTACEQDVDKEAHTASDWIIDTPATDDTAGHKHKECTVCGYVVVEENIPAISAYMPGDINNDSKVNNKDLTRLFQYLSKWNVEVNEAALDVNGDGKVNNKDLTRLFQYLSKWDVEIH